MPLLIKSKRHQEFFSSIRLNADTQVGKLVLKKMAAEAGMTAAAPGTGSACGKAVNVAERQRQDLAAAKPFRDVHIDTADECLRVSQPLQKLYQYRGLHLSCASYTALFIAIQWPMTVVDAPAALTGPRVISCVAADCQKVAGQKVMWGDSTIFRLSVQLGNARQHSSYLPLAATALQQSTI